MVLGSVGEAVEEEVDGEEEDSPHRRAGLRAGCHFLACSWMMQGECRDTEGDQEDDAVFIQRVSLPEDGQMEEHEREEFA